MSKTVNAWWFNNIGIVKVIDEITNEEKFYIGTATGIDEEIDIDFIKRNGSKFFPDLIK